MPNYQATANMLALVRLLEDTHSGRLPVNQIAEELDVNRRTVVRWLKALETEFVDDTGMPLVRRVHLGKVAWAELTGANTVLSANIFQFAATYAATRHLDAGGGSVLSESAADVLNRVEEGMARPLRDFVPRVLQAFHYVPFVAKDYRVSEDTLDVIVRSLIRRHPIDMQYTNAAGGTSTPRLHPWSLVMYRDGFYVLGKIEDDDALRLYAVERIENPVLDRRSTFYVPRDFNPAAEFGRNLGLWRTQAGPERVVIAFDTSVGPTVRSRRWPGFESLEIMEDGRLHLILEVPITPEIKSWILSWGAVAEVLAPASLREAVAAEIAVAAARYST